MSPTPRLIHPVNIIVERLERNELLFDNDAREPFHGPRTTVLDTFKLPAQIRWFEKNDAEAQEAGIREGDSGYVLLRLVDMDRIMGTGERLKRGDRIIKMGVLEDLNVYIIREAPIAHWPDQLGATLIKYFYEDRRPVFQQGDL